MPMVLADSRTIDEEKMKSLPIDAILDDLKTVLNSRPNAVVTAPPGSGKTTRIPLALLNEDWLKGKRILMLEPRRLAARTASRYMAASLGQQVGETVGYRVRFDARVGPKTRIEVITEGILTRMLQTDPTLDGVALIIFDEFHERSLHADLGLMLALESQTAFREDLRLLVMSATLDTEGVAKILGYAPVITGSGQMFPVETHYLKRRYTGRIEAVVVQTISDALAASSGDILVFLPGAGEIRRVQAALAASGILQHVRVAPLYGSLSAAAQDLAILPSAPGDRKVVLATSIAETSLTVEGICTVIDSGLMRVSRYSPRTGLSRLETVRVSRAAADQRRGRAGRLGPGVCFRLWTEQDDRHLEPATMPEVLVADLASLVLELAAWGVTDVGQLPWLDQPPAATVLQARQLLVKLGAAGADGTITAHGQQMVRTGLSPRLSHMVLKARGIGLGRLACQLAAILSERDFVSGRDIDLRLRVEAIRMLQNGDSRNELLLSQGVDIVACRRIYAESVRLVQQFGIAASSQDDIESTGLVLALAYPDRIGQLRGEGRFLLENGRGAYIADSAGQAMSHSPYIVVAELAGQGSESRIFLAAPVAIEQLKPLLIEQLKSEASVVWDAAAQAVRAKICERLGALVIKESPDAAPDLVAVAAALLGAIAKTGLSMLPWSRAARQLHQRLLFISHWEQGWPDVTEAALLASLDSWLGPYIYGLTNREQLAQLNLVAIIESLLSWEQRQQLDHYAPIHIVVPSGRAIAIDYGRPEQPALFVKLQEMFGLQQTPCVAHGKVHLTLHLLSPAQRPVQVTQDLANFWNTTYFEVKKDLMGRYPKHYWPDNPLKAAATNRVRPKKI